MVMVVIVGLVSTVVEVSSAVSEDVVEVVSCSVVVVG